MSLRIYFVGAHSTGKTTLARWTAEQLGLPIVAEVVRSVLAEREIPLDRLKTQVEVHGDVQQEIFERQLAAEERISGGYVSDRAIDNLAYAADGTFIAARVFRSSAFQKYVEHVRTGIVFFARPDRRLVAADGVRDDVSYDSVLRIDGAVKALLEILDIPYIPITPANMQERCRLVKAYVEPVKRLRELERRLATDHLTPPPATSAPDDGDGLAAGSRLLVATALPAKSASGRPSTHTASGSSAAAPRPLASVSAAMATVGA